MIRLFRGLIYGIAAGIAAAFVIDFLDNRRKVIPGSQRLIDEPRNVSAAEPDTSDNLSEDAKQALLDELGAQL